MEKRKKERNLIIEKLRKDLETARENLLQVLSEWHHLKYTVEPKLQFDYECIFGELETKIHEKNLNAKELDKRLELFTKRLSRGENISAGIIDFVNKMVSNEYKRYVNHGVKRAWDKNGNPVFVYKPPTFTVKASNGYNIRTSSANGAKKMPGFNFTMAKEEQIPVMYRKIVKKLHPDATKCETRHFKQHWTDIQNSYKHMDFERIKLYYKVFCFDDEIQKDEIQKDDIKTMENNIRNEIRELGYCTERENDKISEFKQQEPYTYKDLMTDKLWIAKRKRNMRDKLFKIDRNIIESRTQLREITGGRIEKLTTEIFSEQLRESLSMI